MKKLLIILALITVLVIPVNAGMIIRPSSTGGSCDSCTGDLMFAWHAENADVTLGTPCGCSDGDEVGTPNNTVELSTTQKVDGTYSIYSPGTFDRYLFDISSDDIIDVDEGKVILYLYLDTFENRYMIFWDDATALGDDYAYIILSGTSTAIDIKGFTRRNAVNYTVIANANRVEDEWIYIEYRWKVGGSPYDHWIRVCDSDGTSNCVTTQELDSLPASTANNTKLYLGLASSSTIWIGYVDNVAIYATSGL